MHFDILQCSFVSLEPCAVLASLHPSASFYQQTVLNSGKENLERAAAYFIWCYRISAR